jgi:hypothetical protein
MPGPDRLPPMPSAEPDADLRLTAALAVSEVALMSALKRGKGEVDVEDNFAQRVQELAREKARLQERLTLLETAA